MPENTVPGLTEEVVLAALEAFIIARIERRLRQEEQGHDGDKVKKGRKNKSAA